MVLCSLPLYSPHTCPIPYEVTAQTWQFYKNPSITLKKPNAVLDLTTHHMLFLKSGHFWPGSSTRNIITCKQPHSVIITYYICVLLKHCYLMKENIHLRPVVAASGHGCALVLFLVQVYGACAYQTPAGPSEVFLHLSTETLVQITWHGAMYYLGSSAAHTLRVESLWSVLGAQMTW